MSWLRAALALALLAAAWVVVAPMAGDVVAAMAQAGWPAILLLAAIHAVPVVLCGLAWGCLVPGHWGLLVLCRWVRDGFNELLALVPLAGEAAALKLLAPRMKPGLAAAAMVADLTAEAGAQLVFTLAGLMLWQAPAALRWGAVGGAVAVVGFVVLQKGGGLRLLPAKWRGVAVHDHLMAIYRRPTRMVLGFALHVAAWLAACAEAWMALRLLGVPVSVAQVVMLESAVFALRSAAFVVPGALGLQEGGYALLAPLIGIPPASAITVSLLKRGREVVMGVPVVVLWLSLRRPGRRDGPGA